MAAAASYEYELRRGDDVIATGRIQLEEPPVEGGTLRLGRSTVRVVEVLQLAAGRRLILSQ